MSASLSASPPVQTIEIADQSVPRSYFAAEDEFATDLNGDDQPRRKPAGQPSALIENRFLDGGELIVLRGLPLAGVGFTVIAATARLESLWTQALAAGAIPAGEDAYQLLRLEAGLPGNPELTEDYIPLEANLWPAVDFQKGCYIGQEIIARMASRGTLARRLAGIRPAAPLALRAALQ